MKVAKDQIVAMIKEMAASVAENKKYLTELDSAIGDGDHGINMDRGFRKVLERLPAVEDKDVGSIFKNVGMSLISAVGGAAGPLYGTYFMEFGKVAAGKEELTNGDLEKMLAAGLNGIKRRGKAVVGEKTMVDALEPAAEAFAAAAAKDKTPLACFQAAVAAAKKGKEATIPMLAKKGRAHYLGERSIGHQDPGATSSELILASMLKVLEG
ncbi:MAG: dihydroxyacetone kinase subunit L [Firmicutes bacterium]|nr:dihydroxyacetone kinase subunit L [Bacillota bacterium]